METPEAGIRGSGKDAPCRLISGPDTAIRRLEILEDRLLLSAAALVVNPPVIVNGSSVPLSSASPVSSAAAQSATSSPTAQPATASVAIQIKPAYSSPPEVMAPPIERIVLNTSYAFDYIISIDDGFASGNSDTVTVTAGQGTLSVTPASGLGITGSSTSSLTLTGTLTTLNAAIGSLVYTPNTNYVGTDSIQISVTNANDGLTGAATVAMLVYAVPSVTIPQSTVMTENSSFNFANTISVADASAIGASDSLDVQLIPGTGWGTLTLGSTTGLTFTNGSNNSRSMTMTGTLANLNAALNGLVYTPEIGFYGEPLLTVGISDPGDFQQYGGLDEITVEGLPAPVVTAPSSASVIENGSIAFPSGSINVSDGEDHGSNADSLSLSVSDGGLTLGSTSGLTFTTGSNGSSAITVTGTFANLNSALSGLVYSPNPAYIGYDRLDVSELDAWDEREGSATFPITVNALPPPSVTVPSDETVAENGLLTFGAGALSLTDTSASGALDALTLSGRTEH